MLDGDISRRLELHQVSAEDAEHPPIAGCRCDCELLLGDQVKKRDPLVPFLNVDRLREIEFLG